MKIQSTPTIRYKCQNSANNHESRQPVSFGLNLIKLAKEVPLKKEQKIIEVLKKIIKTFAKNPRPVAGKLKTVEKITKLDAMSPLKTLARGYSVVEEDGKLIKSVKDVKKDDIVNIRLSDGKVDAKIV